MTIHVSLDMSGRFIDSGGIGFGLQRYDVMPDGLRFVFATADVASPPTQIRIVLDFGLQLASLLRR
jgi:hypothetical protein